ncbi:MAG: phosphoglycerate kinase [archaeon]
MLSLDNFKFISKEKIAGKTVVLRADLNSTVEAGKLIPGPKLKKHADEIKKLSDEGAKLIVISHQGRKNSDDFIELKQHRREIEKLIKKRIQFSGWENKKEMEKRIKGMKKGDVLLMDNSRFLEYECEELSPKEHAVKEEIKTIAELADFFVVDALSIAHRSHATVVGFIPLLPSYIGPYLEKELRALKELKPNNNVLLLGGMKPADSIKVIRNALEEDRASKILLGGILGELALKALGYSLGKKDMFIEEKGFLPLVDEFEALFAKHKNRLVVPVDLAIERNGKRETLLVKDLPVEYNIYDIGPKTVEEFSKAIKDANTVVFNGPLGRFEDERFTEGTKKVVEAIVNSNCFSLIGGGDTLTCLQQLGFKEEQFSHVSLAGKALLGFLSGKKLIALTVLESYG